MKLGIVGLPNVGKSALFNALTSAGAQATNYPFSTKESNTGMVSVPDSRVEQLAALYKPRKTTHAAVEFVDIPGLVRGAGRGEGLGNRFLSSIREVDAIIHVVRLFEDDNVMHVEGSVDPLRDMETLNLELIFADMETAQKRGEKAEKMIKSGEKKFQEEAALAKKVMNTLDQGLPARLCPLTDEERAITRTWFLLTDKPVIYAANVSEGDLGKAPESVPMLQQTLNEAQQENAETMVISARIEAEIAEMPKEEKALFIEELGIGESGLDRLIKASYRLLGLISFLTAGEDECRAWTITRGTKAPQAAGKIHTDLERGFIRAEVVPFETLIAHGSMAVCREKGLVRSEGKEYVMQDGDVTLIRFNV